MLQRPPPPRVLALALLTVALPRARPTPRPLVPLDRNMGAFLAIVSDNLLISRHGTLPQHVRYDKVSHMASPNVYLLEMRDATVAGGYSNVLELYVHVVLSYTLLAGGRNFLVELRAHLQSACRGTPRQM